MKKLYASCVVIFVVACGFLVVTRPASAQQDLCTKVGMLAYTIAERRDAGMTAGAARIAFPKSDSLVDVVYDNPQMAPELVKWFTYGYCLGYMHAKDTLVGA